MKTNSSDTNIARYALHQMPLPSTQMGVVIALVVGTLLVVMGTQSKQINLLCPSRTPATSPGSGLGK